MSEPLDTSVFGQALREHQELREMLGDLRAFTRTPRPDVGAKGSHSWAANLSSRLVVLHDRLFRHFREEEKNGAFDEILRQYPRASRQIRKLSKEHGTIIGSLRELTTDAMLYSEGKEPEDPKLRIRLLALLNELDRHERIETDLIQRLVYQDLGAGD